MTHEIYPSECLIDVNEAGSKSWKIYRLDVWIWVHSSSGKVKWMEYDSNDENTVFLNSPQPRMFTCDS